MTDTLAKTIEAGWDRRESIGATTGGELRDAVETALARLDAGEARVAEIMAELGPLVPARPPVELGTPDEHTLAYRAVIAAQTAEREAFLAAEAAKADSLIRVARMASFTWQRVPPDGQGAFLEQYREAFWRAAQPQRGLAIDSLSTQILRGRLQAAFGRPTRNADAQQRYGYGGSEYIQFEYWFVVNDSIPVLALDLDGPFGRGLVLASDEPHADVLPRLKSDLSDRLAAIEHPDPWLDYYHAYERQAWYRTGYNGRSTSRSRSARRRGAGVATPSAGSSIAEPGADSTRSDGADADAVRQRAAERRG